MSGRTITRFVLLGLFSVVAGIQIGAQNPTPTANTSQAPVQVNKTMPDKLSGTWYREINGAVLEATFTDEELKVCTTHKFDGISLNLTFLAHYSVTKDGLVHGAITGVDWNIKQTKEIDPQKEISTQTSWVRPAEYPLVRKNDMKSDKEVVAALFVSSGPKIGPVFAGSENKIAYTIAKNLPEMAKEGKRKLRVLDPDLVNQFKKNNPKWKDMHPSEWGKKLGVDFVLDIQLEQMSLYQPGSLNAIYEGQADIVVDTHDMAGDPNHVNSDEPIYSYVLPFKYPNNHVLPADTIPQNRFKQDFLEHLAVEIARKHVDRKMESCGDNKSPSRVPGGLDNATLTIETLPLIDCPFSFRVNSTSAGLMVSNIKAPMDPNLNTVLIQLCGMYKSKMDGDAASQKVEDKNTYYGGMTLPSGGYLKHNRAFPPPPANRLQ